MESIKKSELMRELGGFLRVENLESRNGCGSAPNQFELTFEHGYVFQSYRSLVGVKMDDGRIFFSGYHDYSNTTSSHCTRWCGYDCKTRRKMLADGRAVYIEAG